MKLSDKCLPMQTLLYVSFKHILISVTSIMNTPNSLIILYNTSLLAESKGLLKLMYCLIVLEFYFSI
jgi:hypothetical protein